MEKVKSWEVSDAFWERVEPLIPKPERDPSKLYQRKAGGGRKPLPPKQIFEGIVFVLRTGCQWKSLPKERFGSASSIHGYFQKWSEAGFFLALWQAGLAEYDAMEGIAWSWQAIDGTMVKAPLAQDAVGLGPTDRGKKRSMPQALASLEPLFQNSQTPYAGGRAWSPVVDRRDRSK
ncbi:MAG: transposase [Candidatus Lambdaproteobacteria bacterium RIFOXYD1_FULL_56_27]|uniref:Transposase n=1 Tax=Candidatus Lambdaproteobacteria bacterium RIFOXYD2_FULL_56_26 TaxID=1817773 RepID=A0A1F6GX11_9PROT|nr:MAG: transposase [Candidatus Lambdaproteobacteria bacterium RIFOXYC1_FULL_56_13]OGH02713.1 MAG: transposase [Candidatus Lambdaproteobacteria bacterium RIFOXYD2_FULL_56_26]OGH07966.1 MAG: transposase [Candidatus Lambdaproteobacteria bacterium RIFOXYD1_FULL_56_27]